MISVENYHFAFLFLLAKDIKFHLSISWSTDCSCRIKIEGRDKIPIGTDCVSCVVLQNAFEFQQSHSNVILEHGRTNIKYIVPVLHKSIIRWLSHHSIVVYHSSLFVKQCALSYDLELDKLLHERSPRSFFSSSLTKTEPLHLQQNPYNY